MMNVWLDTVGIHDGSGSHLNAVWDAGPGRRGPPFTTSDDATCDEAAGPKRDAPVWARFRKRATG